MNIPGTLRAITELLDLLLPRRGQPEAGEARLYRAALVLACVCLAVACSVAIVLTALGGIR